MTKVRRLQLYRILRHFFVGCGWLIFLYEWIYVSYQTPGREQATLVFVLIPSLLLIQSGIYVWIAHNKRLATQGRRGLATRYTSPVFSRDHLGRRLIVDDRTLLGKEIVISVDGDSKSYTAVKEVCG